MLIPDALRAEMGHCPAVSCLGVKGPRVQEVEMEITTLEAGPHAQGQNRCLIKAT